MAQENRHLTTEQLSAHLDGQLSDIEQSQLDSHLKTCEQCQQELTDLRRTVALLHALPRPALPRSFVLPLDIQPSLSNQREDKEELEDEADKADKADKADHAPIALATAQARRPVTGTEKPARRWPTYVRTALRTVSSIAAVIGLVLFLSGALATLPHSGSAITMTTSTGASAPSQGDNTTQAASVATSGSANNKGGVEPQISPSSRATITPHEPTPSARATAIPGSLARTPATARPPQSAYSTASTPAPSQLPTILFFDLSSGPGRLGFGFLLLLLGVMGYVVFKRRWRQERA